MAALSISKAWEESKAILAHDGRLIAAVALALMALPTAILDTVVPGGPLRAIMTGIEDRPSLFLLIFVVLVILLIGQLAVTRLAIGPSVSVGGAISHAIKRLPYYIAAALFVGAVTMLALVIAALIVSVTVGASVSQEELAKSPIVAVTAIAISCLYIFLLVRIMCLAAAVTSTEEVGPGGVIRRSWRLSSGHFWRLFGFFLAFMVTSTIVLFAIGSVAGLLVQATLGKPEALSASAAVLALIEALVGSATTTLLAVMLARIYAQLASGGEAQASVPSSGT